jgi:hypothetical protein
LSPNDVDQALALAQPHPTARDPISTWFVFERSETVGNRVPRQETFYATPLRIIPPTADGVGSNAKHVAVTPPHRQKSIAEEKSHE